MPDRAVVVHATHLLWAGSQVVTDPAQALAAVTSAVRRALGFKEPARAVGVFDASTDGYAWPGGVEGQLEDLIAVLRGHGLSTVVADEPIQVCAAYVQAALDDGLDVVVVGTDKRFAQLVSDDVWWYDAYKRVRYTPELVRKRFEVLPPVVDGWLALVGDRDALPGVKGVGKKGATELIKAHGSVDVALEQLADLEGRTGKALRAAGESVAVELARARLDRAHPLPAPWSELPFTPPSVADLNALVGRLGFHHLLIDDGPAVSTTVCTSGGDVAAFLGRVDGPVALHVVHEAPSAARGALVGLAMAHGERVVYVPAALLDALQGWLEDAGRPKIGHDTKSIGVALARVGIALAGVIGDAETASHQVDPTGLAPHDLHDIARRVLQRAVPDTDAVLGVGRKRKRWAALDPQAVADHAGPRAAASQALWQRFAPSLDAEQDAEYQGLGDVLKGMELRGFAVDRDDLAASGREFLALADELAGQIHELAGKEFNVGSTKQLGTVLYEELGLPVMKRTKTGWSTATSALERIEHAHPIVPLVMRWRLVRWLRTTWSEALAKAIEPDGRVRATFHHARSFSGRIIASSPDLGRVPGRTPEMNRIRHAFHAAPGHTLVAIDYDQLGLYVLAHLSGDDQLVSALHRGEDLHAITASAVLDVPRHALTHEQRQIGKVTNFGTFAGQGASALALQLGMTAAEAKDVIRRFYEHYAGVKRFQDGEVAHAREHGWIETIGGRRQRVSGFDSLDTALSSYADRVGRRATHEGSVADVTRRALLHSRVALRDAGLKGAPVHQILDEVLFEVPEDEVEATLKIASEAMLAVYPMRVPLRVTAKAGDRWGTMQPIDIPS